VAVRIKPSLILWTLISIFLVFWLGMDVWSGIFSGEIRDLRTGNILSVDNRPFWFSFVFIVKVLAVGACLYFLFFIWRRSNNKGYIA